MNPRKGGADVGRHNGVGGRGEGGGRGEKAHWIAEYNSFLKKVKILENETDNKLFGKKGDLPPYAADLLAYHNELEKLRISEERSMFTQLEKIKVSVVRLRNQVQSVKHARDETYVTTLENLMNYIEREVVNFKSAHRARYEDLNREEIALERDISLFEKRMENIEQEATQHSQGPPNPTKPKMDVEKVKGSALPPEVVTLQVFLQEHGGPTGGWLERDHQQFLKIRGQCKGSMQLLVNRCLQEIPEKDEDTVEDHEKWYNTFSSLVQAQKTAIERWKTNKDARKATDLLQHEEKLAEEAERVRQEQRNLIQKQRQEKEQKVLGWKEEQARKLREEKEQAKQEEERKKQEERERENRRRAIIKERLNEFLSEKEEEERQKREEEEARKRETVHKVSAKDLERFQEKDRMKEIEKQQKAMMDEYQKAEKAARLEKLRKQVQINVTRDPSRLTQPTAAHEARVHEEEQKSLYPNMAFVGPFATRRAVPAWRQGL